MKVWTNNKNDRLEALGLSRGAESDDMERLPTNRQTARVLCDGEY